MRKLNAEACIFPFALKVAMITGLHRKRRHGVGMGGHDRTAPECCVVCTEPSVRPHRLFCYCLVVLYCFLNFIHDTSPFFAGNWSSELLALYRYVYVLFLSRCTLNPLRPPHAQPYYFGKQTGFHLRVVIAQPGPHLFERRNAHESTAKKLVLGPVAVGLGEPPFLYKGQLPNFAKESSSAKGQNLLEVSTL